MAVRCEYCGQLYEGLICPYCCAPRGESEEDECVEPDHDSTMTIGDYYEIFDSIKEMCDSEWNLTNSSCVGNNNVVNAYLSCVGNNNVINAFCADNVPYYVHHDVWPEDEPSERDETIDAICGTCTHDAQVIANVRELAEEQTKKHRISLRWTVINLICAWFGAFSLGMLIGAPVGFSIVVATVFCTVIGCCIAIGEIYDI